MTGFDYEHVAETVYQQTMAAIEKALAPMRERLAVLEARQADMAKALDVDARLRAVERRMMGGNHADD
jgi:hypothetical protein